MELLAIDGTSNAEKLMPWIRAIAVGFAFVPMGGKWGSMHLGQPLLEIVERWSRICALSLAITYLTYGGGWWSVETRPPWTMAHFLFLGGLLFVKVRT